MKYVLGIDSGGTKYLVRAQDLAGNDLARIVGPPACHHGMALEQMLVRINDNIDACLAKLGEKREHCVSMVCGISGIDCPQDQLIVDEAYQSLPGFSCPILCVNDAVVAHYAVTGGVGALVIAGTGSIAYARDRRGREARCGGWPPVIFGDDGSGTWIACQALHLLTLLFDGRIAPSLLTDRLQEALHLRRREDLIALCIEMEQSRWSDPGLSAMVDEAAAQGDDHAAQILQRAAACTAALADTVIARLELQREASFRVGAWGSAIAKSPSHFSRFKEILLRKYPNAQILVSEKDAAQGACAMALRQLQP